MSDSTVTVDTARYIATTEALVSLIHQNDELAQEVHELRDTLDTFLGADEVCEDCPIPFGLAADHEPIGYSLTDLFADPYLNAVKLFKAEPATAADVGTGHHEAVEAFTAQAEPLAIEARKFHKGDVIPADVTRVLVAPVWETDAPIFLERDGDAFYEVQPSPLGGEDAYGWWGDADTGAPRSGWSLADFPLTVASVVDPEPELLTLRETAELLQRQGADTGHFRLRRFLNTGISWTDAYNEPRECARDKYLVMTQKANASRGAVIKVTPEGVNALAVALGVSE